MNNKISGKKWVLCGLLALIGVCQVACNARQREAEKKAQEKKHEKELAAFRASFPDGTLTKVTWQQKEGAILLEGCVGKDEIKKGQVVWLVLDLKNEKGETLLKEKAAGVPFKGALKKVGKPGERIKISCELDDENPYKDPDDDDISLEDMSAILDFIQTFTNAKGRSLNSEDVRKLCVFTLPTKDNPPRVPHEEDAAF